MAQRFVGGDGIADELLQLFDIGEPTGGFSIENDLFIDPYRKTTTRF